MKKISILIPVYNEEKNVVTMSNSVTDIMQTKLSSYDWELVFIDNDSHDTTKQLLHEICRKNRHIKAILNARNFGWQNSHYYGMCQTTGDCTILMASDFQEPPYLIPEFVKKWENGAKIVSAIKTHSKENKIMYFIRSCYYKLIKKMSDVEQIEHFTGFGLYDKSFMDVLRNLNDPTPFLRGIVAELGFKRVTVEYEQEKRKAGKSSFNLYKLYDLAMISFTSYTKVGLRIATFGGLCMSVVSLVIGLYYFIYKLIHWTTFQSGIAAVIVGVFVLGSLQMFFIGLLGEYIMSINTRVMNRPLVIEEERINFDEGD